MNPRVPHLDGLRGVAVLLVVADHGWMPGFGVAGVVGVTVFFVLSGYLITGLLDAERAATGALDLRGFYGRRARRLLPALLPVLAVTLATFGRQALPSVVASLGYAANLFASFGPGLLTPLHHMWSLSVEEQFYAVWPACLLLLPAPRRFGRLVLAALAVRVAVMAAFGLRVAYHLTPAVAFPLLAGGWLARRPPLPRLPVWCGPLLLAFACVPVPAGDWWVFARTLLAVPAALALIVSPPAWLSAGWLRYVGRVSYGLYLWHVYCQWVLGGVEGAAVAFGLAVASHRLLEPRFYRPRPAVAVVP